MKDIKNKREKGVVKMIDKLTDEQRGQLAVYRDKWIKIGLSTATIDVEKATEAIKDVYVIAELEPPKHIVIADSPKHAVEIAKEMGGKEDALHSMIYGNHDADWLGFYDFMLNVLGIEAARKLEPLMRLALHSGWVSTYEYVAIIQHRPVQIERDEEGRLHNPNGAAVRYRDGWSLWQWHGVRVPSEWITDSPTVEDCLNDGNAELRRCAIEIYGVEKLLKEHGSKISTDDYGTLWSMEFPESESVENIKEEDIVMVELDNSTPEPNGTYKTYFLRVPSTMKTAHEAAAWTFNKTVEEYSLTEES